MSSAGTDEYDRDTQSKREGMLALSQSQKLTEQMDRIMYENPFTTLIEVRRRLAPYCITPRYDKLVQNLIDEAIDYGLTWQIALPFKDFLRRIYENEKAIRGGPNGPKNISQFGTLTASRSGPKGLLRGRISPEFFVEYLSPGIDALVIADKGFGKTCFVGQDMIIPWIDTLQKHVVSGIECLNPRDFYIEDKPFYHRAPVKSQNFITIAKLQLESLESDEHCIQTIMLANDEASQDMNKQRSMTMEALAQDSFLAIERHFGVASVWIYQTERNVPMSLAQFATMRYVKQTRKTVLSTINIGDYVEITHVRGLKGLEQLKRDGSRYFDYPTIGKPDFSPWDIDMSRLRHFVNQLSMKMIDEKADPGASNDTALEAQIRFFKAVLLFLMKEADRGKPSGLPSRADVIKVLGLWYRAWMLENGRSGKTTAQVNLPMLCSVIPEELNVTPSVISKTIGKLARHMAKNEEKWTVESNCSEEERQMMLEIMGDDADKFFS
jgi:hypothetical protein